MKPFGPAPSERAGFTLVETLVVLLILSSMSALVLVAISARSPKLRVEADATQVAAALRVTRSAAMKRNMEMAVVFDADRCTIASPAIPTSQLDPDIHLSVMIAAPERASRSQGGIRFYPNGQSSGGEIRLRLGPAESTVRVNWATGYAGISP